MDRDSQREFRVSRKFQHKFNKPVSLKSRLFQFSFIISPRYYRVKLRRDEAGCVADEVINLEAVEPSAQTSLEFILPSTYQSASRLVFGGASPSRLEPSRDTYTVVEVPGAFACHTKCGLDEFQRRYGSAKFRLRGYRVILMYSVILNPIWVTTSRGASNTPSRSPRRRSLSSFSPSAPEPCG